MNKAQIIPAETLSPPDSDQPQDIMSTVGGESEEDLTDLTLSKLAVQ